MNPRSNRAEEEEFTGVNGGEARGDVDRGAGKGFGARLASLRRHAVASRCAVECSVHGGEDEVGVCAKSNRVGTRCPYLRARR